MNAKQNNPWFKKGNPLSVPKIPDVRLQQENQSKIELVNGNLSNTNQNGDSNKPDIFRLNRKFLLKIFNELDTESLARVSRVCRRFNNTVMSLVENLQVNFDWYDEDYDYQIINNDNHNQMEGFKQVTLRYYAPKDFFYPNPAFRLIKQLYLCFEDRQEDIIDLTKYRQLKYLKIRGALIQLSGNRLPTLTHLDIDDPDNLQKQVARNIKNYHLEVDLESLSMLHNAKELKRIEYIFTKSLDILLDKPYLEQISFTVSMVNMDLLVFEEMVDALDTFLKQFEEKINRGFVSLLLKHSTNYDSDGKRWKNVWRYLEELPNNHPKFSLEIRELKVKDDRYNIPVD